MRSFVRTQHVLVDLEVLDEDVEHASWHALVDLKHRRKAVSQLAKALVHRLQQVVGFVLLDHHVGVAHDAENVAPLARSSRGKATARSR